MSQHITTTPSKTTPRRRRRKRSSREPVTFERRFLSERYRGGRGALEVAVVWRGNVMEMDTHEERATLSVGSSEDVTYGVEHESVGARHVLMRREGDAWELRLRQGMGGFILFDREKRDIDEVIASGDARPVGDGVFALRLEGTTRAKIVLGEVSLLVHYVSVSGLSLPLFAGLSFIGLLGGVVFSVLVHALFGGFIANWADSAENLALDSLDPDSAFAEALITPEDEEIADDEDEIVDEEEPEADEANEVAREETSAGEDGGPTADVGAASSLPPLAGEPSGGGRASVQGRGLVTGDLNTLISAPGGSDLIASTQAWEAASEGNLPGGPGTGPLTARGAGCFGADCHSSLPGGPGGDGGTGIRTIKGDPDAKETAHDWKPDPKPTRKPTVVSRRPDFSGTYSERIIRRVINQHKREIKACYTRALMKDKGLSGRVKVQFIIDPTGNVQIATVVDSTLRNPSVERCLTGRVKSWRFPSPKDGGLVKVTYPFVFEMR